MSFEHDNESPADISSDAPETGCEKLEIRSQKSDSMMGHMTARWVI